MVLKRIALFWLIAMVFIAACSRGGNNQAAQQPSAFNTVAAVTAIPSPEPTSTLPPTSTPIPTPIVPAIEVDTQTISETGELLINEVFLVDAGWVVIYQDLDGEPGEILGYGRLVPGENSEIIVDIDPRQATTSLTAQLHEDVGEMGVFEFPDTDNPIRNGEAVVAETFTVDIQLPIPTIDVGDQTIGADGLLNVNNVYALEDGWLVVHNYRNKEIGGALGQIPVQPGNNNDLSFPVRWRVADTALIAILYEDAEQPGGFDPKTDLPVLEDGSAVVAEFSVSLPPDILVFDQPLLEDKIVVERVTSVGPGWIVAYYDEEGEPGLIIGSAYITDGINELVVLELLETAATPRLYLMLHEDSGVLGEFDFPAADLPIVYDGQPVPPVTMLTTPGNYLITADQTAAEDNSIVVPLVVTDLDAWVVIYSRDEEGAANEVLGQTWLPAGINRDVKVTVDLEMATNTLLALLHQDNAPQEEFDFPEGLDNPLLRNFLPIQSQFTLETTPEAGRSLP
jgi:hypothetical protein